MRPRTPFPPWMGASMPTCQSCMQASGSPVEGVRMQAGTASRESNGYASRWDCRWWWGTDPVLTQRGTQAC
jgi:hypothetical protein